MSLRRPANRLFHRCKIYNTLSAADDSKAQAMQARKPEKNLTKRALPIKYQ
jgi:hypothetical protein